LPPPIVSDPRTGRRGALSLGGFVLVSWEDIYDAGLGNTVEYRVWLNQEWKPTDKQAGAFFRNEQKFHWPEFERWRDWYAVQKG
jgi:hypothetical protein